MNRIWRHGYDLKRTCYFQLFLEKKIYGSLSSNSLSHVKIPTYFYHFLIFPSFEQKTIFVNISYVITNKISNLDKQIMIFILPYYLF